MRRLRSRMGVLHGVARVDGQVVVEGTMTFALGPAPTGVAAVREPSALPRDQHDPADLRGARSPCRPLRVGMIVADRVEHRGRQDHAPTHGSFQRSESAMPRVSRSTGPVRANAAPA